MTFDVLGYCSLIVRQVDMSGFLDSCLDSLIQVSVFDFPSTLTQSSISLILLI